MKTRPSVKNKTRPVRISQSGNTISRTLYKMYLFSNSHAFYLFFFFLLASLVWHISFVLLRWNNER